MTTKTIAATFTGAALLLAGAAILAGAALSGCATYSPGGSGFADDTHTYYSVPHEPKTVTLVDTRTGQTLWTYEIPVNRQLTVRFYDDQSPDTPATPAKFYWREFEIGTTQGNLDNEMLVPDFRNRRLDWFIRPAPEFPHTPAKAATAG